MALGRKPTPKTSNQNVKIIGEKGHEQRMAAQDTFNDWAIKAGYFYRDKKNGNQITISPSAPNLDRMQSEFKNYNKGK